MPRQIIGTVRYDTDTATRVHRVDDGQTPPQRVDVLMRGVNGSWFLFRRGTAWQPIGADESTGNAVIQPLTLAEAIQWGQVNMGNAKFNATFGPVITEA